NGTVVRVEKNKNFTAMSNYHLWDKRLSFKAKGLLSFMLSVSDSWKFTIKGLASMAKDGTDSVASAVKELEATGYVVRSRSRNEKGQMGEVEYTIYENPCDNNAIEENADCFIQSDSENENSGEQADTADGAKSIVKNDSEIEEENCKNIKTMVLQKSSDEQPDKENLITAEISSENCSDGISASENNDVKHICEKPKEEKPVLGKPFPENPILDNPIRGKPKQENPSQINTKINKYQSYLIISLLSSPLIESEKKNDKIR
ncbi:MAG: helix-turn-helix domain-containing protein, partial [Eubacterium sp.]|nr:helix-turn-helix domain-containing protein [Eubacterium sp.]